MDIYHYYVIAEGFAYKAVAVLGVHMLYAKDVFAVTIPYDRPFGLK